MKTNNMTHYCLYSIILYHVHANPNANDQVNVSSLSRAANENMSMSGWSFHGQYLDSDDELLVYSPVSDLQNASLLQSVNRNLSQVFHNYSAQSLVVSTSQLSKNQSATFKSPTVLGFRFDSGSVEPTFDFSWVNIDKPKFHTKNECYIDNEWLIPHFTNHVVKERLSMRVAKDTNENHTSNFVLKIDEYAVLYDFRTINAELIYETVTFIIRRIVSFILNVNSVSNNHYNNNTNVYMDQNCTIAEMVTLVENHRIRLKLFAMQIEAWKHLMIYYYSKIARYRFNPNSTKYGCDEATLLEHTKLMRISNVYVRHSLKKTNIYSQDISGFALKFQLDCINYMLRYVFVNAMKKTKQYELRVKQQILEHERRFGAEGVTNESWIDSSTSTRLKDECYDYFLSNEYQCKLEKYRIWIETVYNNSGFSQNGALISNNVSIWTTVPTKITHWMAIIMNIDNIYQKQIEVAPTPRPKRNFSEIYRVTRSKPRQAWQKKTDATCKNCQIM